MSSFVSADVCRGVCFHIVFGFAGSAGVVFVLTRVVVGASCCSGWYGTVLVEVRFPQNCSMPISGCCSIALWVEVSVVWLVVIALPSRLRTVWLISASCCATSGFRYVAVVLAVAFWWVFPEWRLRCYGGERLLALWVEVLPKMPCVVFVCRCSLYVEMSCRHCRLDCLCGSLFGRCRSRCCALGRVSGRGAGQVVFLSVFEFSWLCWWDFVCPHGREVGFISRALWTLPDGWCCFHMAFGAMSCTVATFVAKASFRCMFILYLSCVLEALAVVWCVALSACMSPFRLAMSCFRPSFSVSGRLVRIAPVELSTFARVLYTVFVHPVSCRMSGLALLCGRVVVLTTRKSCFPLSGGWSLVASVARVELGSDIVELWSHTVAPVFRELLCLGRVVLLLLVGVPAALAGRDSLLQEFVAGRSWWRLVRRVFLAV
ncbi:hypothetical protein Taro_053179 [Colocasia esculenta]|uniref:Uncharacterized protein n=1 Tax=Colocasia esculenta TaxID=4460 RepID=A0A843XKH7_COLES|nr:hypothetical protein [Colocasia esculenta]